MNYEVPRERLFNAIYKMIDDYMRDTELRFDYGYMYKKMVKSVIEFYGDEFTEGIDNENLFVYVSREYYAEVEKDKTQIYMYYSKSPLLMVSNRTTWRRRMDKMFGDVWRPVFEKWFSDNNPELPVKTFNYL